MVRTLERSVTFGEEYSRSVRLGSGMLDAGWRVAGEIPHPARENGGFLAAALWWAEHVGCVFPLTMASSDPNDTQAGKRPNGVLLGEESRTAEEIGTRDEAQIRSWWMEQPLANVGLTTRASGILIVDVDPRHGGWDRFLPWCEENEVDLSWVPRSASPRSDGGQHLWWRVPAGASYPHSSLMKGVDRPWQVPVPPSMRWVAVDPESKDASKAFDYRPYRWIAGDCRQLPVAPLILLGDGVATDGSSGASVGASGRIGAEVVDIKIKQGVDEDSPEPQNKQFKRMACSMVARGWDDLAIVEALMESASRTDQDLTRPWTTRDMQTIVAYARKYITRARAEEVQRNQAIVRDILRRP